jgi:hypothetical protein
VIGRRWWNPLLLFPVTLLGAITLFHLILALSELRAGGLGTLAGGLFGGVTGFHKMPSFRRGSPARLRLGGSALLSRLEPNRLRQTAVSGIIRTDVQRHSTGRRRAPVRTSTTDPSGVPAGSPLPGKRFKGCASSEMSLARFRAAVIQPMVSDAGLRAGSARDKPNRLRLGR